MSDWTGTLPACGACFGGVRLRPARPAGNAAGYMQSAPAGALQSLKPGLAGLRGPRRAQPPSSLRMLDEAAVAKNMETIAAGKGEPFALAVSRLVTIS